MFLKRHIKNEAIISMLQEDDEEEKVKVKDNSEKNQE
jgi:hypothetical protein